MYRHVFHTFRSRFLIDRISQYIEHTPECMFAHRYGNRRTGRLRVHTAHKTVGRSHGDTAHCIIPQMLCYLHDQLFVMVLYFNRFVNLRKVPLRKFDVEDCTDNLSDLTNFALCQFYITPFLFYNINQSRSPRR